MLVVVLSCSGCATTSSPRGPFAVLPLRAVGVSPEVAQEIRQGLTQASAQFSGRKAIAAPIVDQAAQNLPSCADSDPNVREQCASEVGARVAANDVLMAAIAGLGNTYVLQAGVLQVDTGSMTRSLEETFSGKPGQFGPTLRSVASRLFDRPPGPAWYKHWWVWTIAGAVVATAVAVPLVLSTGDGGIQLP